MDRYRTITEALKEIKKIDPDSSLNAHNIRMMAKKKLISLTTIGNKRLVNLDSLIAYLNGEDFTPKIIDLSA